ncbi:MAG: cysteine desulfurase [Succinivibrio sp.]|nr:cysteine desulfurase [Succinivibrio sp.]
MRVYADNAATTKISPSALKVMVDAYQHQFGNPSSQHRFGQDALSLLNSSRIKIINDIGAIHHDYLIFTSGGSEADNQAIEIFKREGLRTHKKHIISSKIEHHAILHSLERLANEGFEIELLDVDKNGLINPESLKKAIRADTVGVSIMFSNNEIGTVEPIEEIGAICKDKGVLFLTDAVQAVGHLPIDVKKLHIDLLSASAHKFHGPKGIGFLYINRNVTPTSLIVGGGQEYGYRAGTENVPAIAAMETALTEAVTGLESKIKSTRAKADRIITELLKLKGVKLNGDRVRRAPGNINISVKGVNGDSLRYLIEAEGIAVSAGSACNSKSKDPSHVLKAIGLEDELAKSSIRISIDETLTEDELDYLIKGVTKSIRALTEGESLIK